MSRWFHLFVVFSLSAISAAEASVAIPLTVNLSEAVLVTGTPRIAVDVGGTTRYATYTSGSGTNALTFTLSPQTGDVDLDGITLSSPIDLNGGTMKDAAGNNAALTFTLPNTSGIKVNYPSLAMDFAYDADGRYSLNGTVYNDLTSFLTATGGSFTRTTTATYFDSTGTLQTAASGTPRFDYDPITHTLKGILIEESRTNSIQRSQQFDDVFWVKLSSSITPNVATAPDGTSTADQVVTATDTNSHGISMSAVSTTSGSFWTASIYVKPAGYNYGYLWLDNGAGNGVTLECDLSSGAIRNTRVITTYYTNVATSCTSVGSGWWRMVISATTSLTSVQMRFYASPSAWVSSSFGTPTAPGDGVSGAYIWGAQLEQGAFPTSYIPTTSAATTRAQDNLWLPAAGWSNSVKGTFALSAYKAPQQTVSARYYGLYQNAGNAQVSLMNDISLNRVSAYVTDTSATAVATIGSSTLTTGNLFKSAFAFDQNDFSSVVNAGAASTDNSGTFSGLDRLAIGNNVAAGPRPLNGWIKTLKYYPTRVPDAQLQALTQ